MSYGDGTLVNEWFHRNLVGDLYYTITGHDPLLILKCIFF